MKDSRFDGLRDTQQRLDVEGFQRSVADRESLWTSEQGIILGKVMLCAVSLEPCDKWIKKH